MMVREMPLVATRERFVHIASMATLGLSVVAAATATVIARLQPVPQPMDLIVPPIVCVVFLILLAMLSRYPHRVLAIMRTSLLMALIALSAPAWFYTWQAAVTPGLRLVDIYPPVAALFMALMVMVMIYLPPKPALIAVSVCWMLVALPVLIYLFAHPDELHTPRGADLLMSYGPVLILLAVLLPIQRGLNGKIQHLVSEQAKMEVMVNRDPLTGLYNRRFGEQVLQDMTVRQVSAGVIMFDLDRFKAINDTHGHPIGDLVLQRVALRCGELIRSDACLTRWGGEEFLVLVHDVDAQALQRLAERLRVAIADLVIEQAPSINASFGIALRQPEDSTATVLHRVDQALYRAKQEGGNRVLW